MSELFKNTYCQLNYESNSDYIEVAWSGFPKSDQFREACNILLDFMKELGIKKLLTDNTNVKLFAVTDQRWLNQVWLPQAEALGYCCSATLSNNDVVVKTAVSNITNRRDKRFIAKQFTNREEAKKWLAQIKPQ